MPESKVGEDAKPGLIENGLEIKHGIAKSMGEHSSVIPFHAVGLYIAKCDTRRALFVLGKAFLRKARSYHPFSHELLLFLANVLLGVRRCLLWQSAGQATQGTSGNQDCLFYVKSMLKAMSFVSACQGK